MRNYETVFIMDPSLADDRVTEEITKARSILESASSEIISVQKWGKRKLAYEIKKRREGIYAVIKFRGDGASVAELERNFRLSEPVIRFMTVVDTNPVPEGGAEDTAGMEPEELAAGEAAAVPEETAHAVEAGAATPKADEAAPTEDAESAKEKSAPASTPETPPSSEPSGEGESTAT